MKQFRWLTALVVGAFLLAACGGMQAAVPEGGLQLSSLGEATYTETWDGRGTDSEKCRVPDMDDPRYETFKDGLGWIHWVFATKGASTDARLYIGAEVYAPGEPLNANIWHFYTPFMDLEDLEALEPYIELFGGAKGPGGGLVISDYCPGRGLSLDVRKTAYAEFEREHEWDIAKKVETKNEFELEDGTPKIWLYTDGSGDETATWTVTVKYEGPVDSDFVVYGTIEIENISNPAATKTVESIVDDLGFPGYDDIDLACVDGEGAMFDPKLEMPRDILAGEVWTCDYRVEVAGAKQGDEGTNSVTVEVDNDQNIYGDTADWKFEDPNQPEDNKCVTITDTNRGFAAKYGDEDGVVKVCVGVDVNDPDDVVKFDYSEDFAFEDYAKCGSFPYPNTATIVETRQYADALLKVNVQCYIYESAWALGEDEDEEGGVVAKPFCDNGFSNWGWTNAISRDYTGSWPLYAGAAQCDPEKGMLVGYFEVTHDGDKFEHDFDIFEGFDVADPAVYADGGMFPLQRNGRPTTAPGQYYVADSLAYAIHVIAHVNVGTPDPDFGPKVP